jgi:DNA polymerase IV
MPVTDSPGNAHFPAPPTADGPVVFDWLFLDLNSYFASVEQQENPRLRGKPVAVVPVETDFTCAIAASYEARKFGIKTGTGIREARLKCPQLVCVLADHRKYTDYHRNILKEVERHVPVEKVVSVDEVACRLYGEWRKPEGALALARRIKDGIQKNIGGCLTSSIGISTNRFLAKTASDLHKPDGLVTLHPSELPGRIAHLELHDLCGIGRNMEKRLWRAGVFTIEQLWACAPKQLRAIWRSVAGERFWHMLRGVELPGEPTTRRMVGHSHVLAPVERPAELAGLVLRRLLLKAASRLRRLNAYATMLDIGVRVEKGPRIGRGLRLPPTCDNFTLLDALVSLWQSALAETGPVRFMKVSVTLHGLVPAEELRQLELFSANAPAPVRRAEAEAADIRRQRRERLSEAMEALNRKYGRDSVTLGVMPGTAVNFTGAKVAFNRVPEVRDFEDLGERRAFSRPARHRPARAISKRHEPAASE